MTITGPISARPESAKVGTLFWDKNESVTYIYTDNGWVDTNAKTVAPKADPKAEPKVVEVKAEEPKPVKTVKAKKTTGK